MWWSRWSLRACVSFSLFVGCAHLDAVPTSDAQRSGDDAASSGNWPNALKWYSTASRANPGLVGIRAKYEDARSHVVTAYRGALSLCEALPPDQGSYCSAYSATNLDSVGLDDAETSSLRGDLAKVALAAASDHSAQGEYLPAARDLAEAKRLSPSTETVAGANSISTAMGPGVEAYLKARSDALKGAHYNDKEFIRFLNEAIEILREMPNEPQKGQALAMFRMLLQQATGRVEKAAQQAEREADAQRTVSVVGVLIAPTKVDGGSWDLGGGDSSEAVSALNKALVSSGNPYAAAAGILSGLVVPTTSKPDAAGTAQLYIDGNLVGEVPLDTVQDSFAPTWSNAQWTHVDVRSARVRITLRDVDPPPLSDDPIGTVEINSDQLKAARDQGGVFHLQVNSQGNAQILFVDLSVM
jgi:tetratricopeptide (TPR) repeat protein